MNLYIGKIIDKIQTKYKYYDADEEASVLDDSHLSELDFIDDISDVQKKEMNFVDEADDNIDADPFLHSLENLTPEDIPLMKIKAPLTLRQKFIKALRAITLIACLSVFLYCSFMLIDNLIQKRRANELYEQLASEFDFAALAGYIDDGSVKSLDEYESAILLSPPLIKDEAIVDVTTQIETESETQNEAAPPVQEQEKSESIEIETMKAKLNSLTLKNPDTYGWIYVPGTTINYPIVQGTDNDYYLNHSYDGKSLVVGSIFADYRGNKNILRNYNTVIYGHNVTNGSMFNHVTKFLKESVFNDTLIYVYTFDGAYVYEPFAIYETKYDYQYFRMEFTSGEDFVDFAYEMQANSKFNKDMTFTETDRIITLSTCTNGAMNARYALQAKLVNIIK